MTKIINPNKRLAALNIRPFNQSKAHKLSNVDMADVYEAYGIRNIGYVDIECTNLHPEFGNVITICNLKRDVKTEKLTLKTYKTNSKEIQKSVDNRKVDFDKRIIKEFYKDFDVELAIGHYSSGWNKMDFPFLRGRALICGIQNLIPPYGKIKYGDTWKLTHMSIKSHSYTLDAVGHITGAKTQKTRIAELEWQLAKYGNPKGIGYVLDHNIRDVKRTYQVHKAVERFNPIPTNYV